MTGDICTVEKAKKRAKRLHAIGRKCKPCPLCGGRVYYDEVLFGSRLMMREVRCYACRLAMTGKSQKRLIENWNRRASAE